MKHTSTFKTKAFWLFAICFGVITTNKAQSVAQILADINVSSASAAGTPSTGSTAFGNTYIKVGSKIIFRASDGTTANTNYHGPEIFVLDLSQPLTGSVGGNAPGSSANPWTTTTNPAVIDLLPTAFGSAKGSGNPQEFVVSGNKVYCSVAITLAAAGSRNFGTELMEYDASQPISDSAGTGRYTTFTNPKIIDLVAGSGNSLPNNLNVINNTLYFQATTASNGVEFWKYDISAGVSSNNGSTSFDSTTNPRFINIGSDAGAVFGSMANAGIPSGTSSPITGCAGKVYFSAASGSTIGNELWEYDPSKSISNAPYGLTTNPKMLGEVNYFRGVSSSGIQKGSNPMNMTDFNGKLVYRCNWNDTLGTATGAAFGMWIYDPSVGVKDSAAFDGGVSGRFGPGTNPGLIKLMNQSFQPGTNIYGASTASPAGTGLNVPNRFQIIGNNLYFNGIGMTSGGVNNGFELWKTDGTASGTRMIKTLWSGTATANSGVTDIYAYNGLLYFNGKYAPSGGTVNCHLFVYDPSQDTTTSLLLDSTTNPKLIYKNLINNNGLVNRFAGYNGKVYFQIAESEGATNQLGIYDPSKTYNSAGAGTYATKLNATTNPKMIFMGASATASNPAYFTDYNGILLFGAAGTTGGNELYKMNIYNAVTASAGSNGSISNSGSTNVNYGDNQTYTITAASGYCADSLIVDGVKVAPASSYTFTNVTASHTIIANFIATVTPSVSISTSTTTICSGSNTSFTAVGTNGGSNPSYQWKKNGINAGTGSSITFLSNTLSNNDVITCVLTANNACQTSATANSNAITMTVKTSPSLAQITNGISTISSASLCTLGSTYKYYDATPYGTWSSSNPSVASITGVSQAGSVTANTNGTATISYNIAATNGCVSTSSVVVTVAAITPNAITGNNSICVNATTSLSCTAPVGTTGVWSSSNNLGTINVSGVYTGTNAGTYAEARYTVTNATTGCKAYSSKTITVNPTPVVPTITFASGTLVDPRVGAPTGGFCVGRKFRVAATPNLPAGVWTATGAASIAGTDTVKINAVGTGSIKYTYTSAAGCVNSRTMNATGYTCAARGLNTVDVQLSTVNGFTMYPNPAKGFINLNIETLIGAGNIVVTDLYGKTVKTQALSMGANTVNIANLSKGMYFVSTITNEGKTTKKLVVE
jgi:ELWxxDGT repeat protein